MFLKKFFVGVLLVFGLHGELYAGFTILSDVGQQTCTLQGISQSECDNDMQCTASKKVCEIALDNLGSLVEGEAMKQIIKYGGQGTVYLSKKIAEFGINNSKSIVTELLGKVGNAMKYNTRINKVKGLSPKEIGSVFADIIFGIGVDIYVDHLPEESFDLVRNSGIPGFKTAPTEAIKKSMKRLIMLSKNNFMFLMSPNKISGARDAIVGDALILAEIGVDVKDSAVEATGSRLALVKSQKIGEILNLYIEDRKAYFQDPRTQSDKYSMITDFEERCNALQLDGLDGFLASLNSGEYSLSVINAGLRSQCQKYSDKMVEDERTKNDFIEISTYFSKERYGALLNLYFPPSEHSRLWELYEEREALDNQIASDELVAYSEEGNDDGKLLFNLPETATIDDNHIITASQGEMISFSPDYSAKSLIDCINNLPDEEVLWELIYEEGGIEKTTHIELDKNSNTLTFIMPSVSIKVLALNYEVIGSLDGSCPLPNLWENSIIAMTTNGYSRNNSGVVIDHKTQLEWQDDYTENGYNRGTYAQVIAYCNSLSLDGGGWRLPTRIDLQSIVDTNYSSPTINPIFSNFLSEYYWTTTSYSYQNITLSNLKYSISFGNGSITYADIRNYAAQGICVRDRQSASIPTPTLIFKKEFPEDDTVQKETFTKEWEFGADLTGYSIEVLISTYGTYTTPVISGNTISMDLTPNLNESVNDITLQLKNSNGDIVLISGSETFWSKTKTNHAPRLADGQITQLVSDTSLPAILEINTYDADGDNVTLTLEDSSGGSVSLNGNTLSASFSDGQVHHVVKIGLGDGKEKVIKEFNVLQFDQTSIDTFYSDVDKNAGDYIYDGIAFGTLKGVIWGQPDPNDATKRIFRPTESASFAEALKMIINAEKKAGLIELPTSDVYLDILPQWAMPYYSFARETGALDKETLDLASIYPTRETIAKLIVKTLDLDKKIRALPESNISFSDEVDFSSVEMLSYAKTAKAFGLFMTEDNAKPKDTISRAELAMVIRSIFMIPTATLTITPATVEYGDTLTAELNNIHAEDIDASNYSLYDASSELKTTYRANGIEITLPLNTGQLEHRFKTLYAVLDNNGVKNIVKTTMDMIFTDQDNDGVQDKDDAWQSDERYIYDENSNGIPDILDSIYFLSSYTPNDSVIINGELVAIADIIRDGGVMTASETNITDDFSTDTTSEYSTEDTWTAGGVGSFTYDSPGTRADMRTGDNVGMRIFRDVPSSTEGSFSIDFLPTVKYPSGGVMALKLEQDANTYYKIGNTDGYGTLSLSKYVGGVEVDSVPFASEYAQNINYTIAVNFTPSLTTVEAFGETLVINNDTTAVNVSRFSVELTQQDGYLDNLIYHY